MQISIITAYYNGRQYLSDYIKMIIRSAANLRRGDTLEVILVCDSTDDRIDCTTIKALSETFLSQSFTYVFDKVSLSISNSNFNVTFKVLCNDTNRGIHYSRVRGLKESSGEYIIFLDQDDYLSRYALREYANHASHRSEVIVSNAISQRTDTYLKWYRTKAQTDMIGSLTTYINVGTQIISPGQCFIYRDAIPDEWTEYICTNNGADDYFLWLLMISLGVEFRYINRCLYLHRYTDNNLSNDTKVTDESTYEFCAYLREIPYFPNRHVKRLLRMTKYKAHFRDTSYIDKAFFSLLNIDIFIANVIYKIITKTPIGFNR